MLDDCALCENKEDPRFGAYIGERRFPLCDGCGGPVDSKEKAELFAKLRTLPSVVVHACSRCGNPGDADFTTCETTWCRAFREGAKSAPMPGAAPVAEPCVDCKAAGMPEHFRAIGHTEVCAYPEHDWKRPKAGP